MTVQEADALFLRGDYQAARAAFASLRDEPSLTDADRALVQARLQALKPDGVALGFGVVTAAVVILVYLLSRFVL